MSLAFHTRYLKQSLRSFDLNFKNSFIMIMIHQIISLLYFIVLYWYIIIMMLRCLWTEFSLFYVNIMKSIISEKICIEIRRGFDPCNWEGKKCLMKIQILRSVMIIVIYSFINVTGCLVCLHRRLDSSWSFMVLLHNIDSPGL